MEQMPPQLKFHIYFTKIHSSLTIFINFGKISPQFGCFYLFLAKFLSHSGENMTFIFQRFPVKSECYHQGKITNVFLASVAPVTHQDVFTHTHYRLIWYYGCHFITFYQIPRTGENRPIYLHFSYV